MRHALGISLALLGVLGACAARGPASIPRDIATRGLVVAEAIGAVQEATTRLTVAGVLTPDQALPVQEQIAHVAGIGVKLGEVLQAVAIADAAHLPARLVEARQQVADLLTAVVVLAQDLPSSRTAPALTNALTALVQTASALANTVSQLEGALTR